MKAPARHCFCVTTVTVTMVQVTTVLMTIGAASGVFGQTTPADAPTKSPTDADSDLLADPRSAVQDPAIERLRTTIARLQRTLAPLTAEKNLIDNLYYPLFDRPRRRATLAVLIKVTQLLNEEVAAHRRGRGGMPIARLIDAATWCETAIGELDQVEEERLPLPHRTHVTVDTLRLDADDVRINGQSACLVGWIDGSRRPFHPDTRDLDLLACLGVRIYALSPDILVSPRQRREILARCQALGIGFLDRLETDPLPRSLIPDSDRPGFPGPDESEVARVGVDLSPAQPVPGSLGNALRAVTGWSEAISRFYAPALREIMRPKTTSSPLWTASIVPAVRDPSHETFLPDSLAMREILMGACDRYSMVATRWHIPRLAPNGDDIPTSAQWRAGMWLHTLTGQRIGLLDGWTEFTSGPPTPRQCVFLYPGLAETAAHTALEIQAAGHGISAFPGQRDLAFVVGPSACKPGQDTWTEGFLALYRQCMEHQLYPRLLPAGALADPLRYRALRTVVVTNAGDTWNKYRGSLQALRRAGVQIIGWERDDQQADGIKQDSAELADRFFVETESPGGLIAYLTRMWQEGAILRGQARFTIDRTAEAGVVWARSAVGAGGEYYIALVNWSPGQAKVHVKFPTPYDKKVYSDLLNGRTAAAPTVHDLDPWEVRLLVSNQPEPQTVAGK